MVKSPQSLGGEKRAAQLSPERRSEIAQQAAAARWSMPRATHEGDLNLPGIVPLRVANLEDGRRVMSSRAFLAALGRPWKGTYQRTERPNFIDAKNLNSLVSSELASVLGSIEYLNIRGQTVLGYRAELLPLVCDVTSARAAGNVLTKSQEKVAEFAETIVRGLATIGRYSRSLTIDWFYRDTSQTNYKPSCLLDRPRAVAMDQTLPGCLLCRITSRAWLALSTRQPVP